LEGDFLLPGSAYHRRQADILMRLSLAARDADTVAAFLWLATEHRALANIGENPPQQQQQQIKPKME
jgi:hypothetical protein